MSDTDFKAKAAEIVGTMIKRSSLSRPIDGEHLIAAALAEADRSGFKRGASAQKSADITTLQGLMPLGGDSILAAVRGGLHDGIQAIHLLPWPEDNGAP